MAGLLGPAGQLGGRAQRVLAVGGEIHRVGEGRDEGRGEAAVACVQLADLLDHASEAAPRVRVGHPLGDDGVARADLALEGLGDQRLLGRKAAVQGGLADAGPAGDLPHRHVKSVGGERRAGRVEDEIAVVPGVGAQRVGVRQTIGHRSHFS